MKQDTFSLSLILFFTLYCFSLSGQVGLDLMFMRDGSLKKGTITVEEVNGIALFWYSDKDTPEAVQIDPTQVKSLALYLKGAKGVERQIFIPAQPEGEAGVSFYEQVYDEGKYPIFKKPFTRQYYYQLENEQLTAIATDQEQRVLMLDKLLDKKIKLGQNKYKNASNLEGYEQFTDFLNTASTRYPGTYFGLIGEFSFYNVENLSEQGITQPFLPDGSTFGINRYGVSAFVNSTLNSKGTLAHTFQLGALRATSNGYFEDVNSTTSVASYAASATILQAKSLFSYFFWLGDVYPYVTGGLAAEVVLQQDAILAVYQPIPEGLQAFAYAFDPFQSFMLSPNIGVGVQIPVYDQYAIDIRAAFSGTVDAGDQITIVNELSIGFNLF
ncbi:MAG: hypothetical protein AAF798_03335 [Bacteroidota bacterium]